MVRTDTIPSLHYAGNRVARIALLGILIAFAYLWSATAAAQSSRRAQVKAYVAAEQQSASEDTATEQGGQQQLSDAERIANLDRTIEAGTERLKELEDELVSPTSEYAKAENEFGELDSELQETREQLAQFSGAGKTREAALLERSIKAMEVQWKLAKSRFELAIEERRTLREEISTLKQKIEKDRAELAELKGDAESSESTEEGQGTKQPKEESNTASTTPPAPDSPSESDTAEQSSDESGEPDEELMAAEAEAQEKQKEANEAREEVQEIAARIADLQKLITQEQKGLALTRKQADLALETQRTLEEELARKRNDGASEDEIRELTQAIAEAKLRFTEARQAVTETTDRLNDNRSELANLQQQQIIALQEAEKKRSEAASAKDAVEDLRNPFAPRNMLKWLIEHGPRVVMYLGAMILLLHLAKVFSHRIIQFMAGASGRGTTAERENRAKTLVGVFQNAASVSILIGGTLIILDEMGAKISVLLGGVAVFGLAVAFGAQNLIKDYFYGFVMLLENQYMLNDVVKIGDLTGQVERITLRMTVLRDANGIVHFIPNGQINCVSNETHGWSRAVFEIGVAYKENIDQCIVVLTELAQQLRRDNNFGPMIIEDASVPAVDQLADSSVVLKFFIKTRPNQQGAVRRELLRRIKNRFDDLGIELPYPQRTIYHRYEGANAPLAEPIIPAKKCA
jgi:small conductance mechanosensitive channel